MPPILWCYFDFRASNEDTVTKTVFFGSGSSCLEGAEGIRSKAKHSWFQLGTEHTHMKSLLSDANIKLSELLSNFPHVELNVKLFCCDCWVTVGEFTVTDNFPHVNDLWCIVLSTLHLFGWSVSHSTLLLCRQQIIWAQSKVRGAKGLDLVPWLIVGVFWASHVLKQLLCCPSSSLKPDIMNMVHCSVDGEGSLSQKWMF